jgi:hypothetical protein
MALSSNASTPAEEDGAHVAPSVKRSRPETEDWLVLKEGYLFKTKKVKKVRGVWVLESNFLYVEVMLLLNRRVV